METKQLDNINCKGKVVRILPNPDKPHTGIRYGHVLSIKIRRQPLQPLVQVQVYKDKDPGDIHQSVRYKLDRIEGLTDEEIFLWKLSN